MQIQDPLYQIRQLADQAVQGHAVYVVDVEAKGAPGQPEVWVYIDAEHGQAGIQECAVVARELNVLTDAHEVYAGRPYTLNVSTPGLSRPLKDIRQYRNNLGRKAKVKLRTDDVTRVFEGTLEHADEERVTVKTEEGTHVLAFSEIIETKILPAW